MTCAPGRILVVDDDHAIRGFLSETLVDEGYEVRGASNGEEALATLAAWRPSLILLDLMMPIMDGWTFRARQLAEPSLGDIPVIVMTAARSASTAGLAAVTTFSKPFDLGALLSAVQGIVEARPPAESHDVRPSDAVSGPTVRPGGGPSAGAAAA